MSYQRPQKSLKRLTLFQPDFIYYLAVGIYYVTCALGITSFVFDYKKSSRLHWVQYERRYHAGHAYLRLSKALQSYNIIILLITIALTPFTTYTLYTEMYFLNLTKLLTVVGNIRFTLIQGFAAFIMLLNCCMQRRSYSSLTDGCACNMICANSPSACLDPACIVRAAYIWIGAVASCYVPSYRLCC